MNSLETAKKEGIEEGIQQRSLEIAKSLLDILDNETIALKTGLTLAEVEGLRVKSN
jgi:predicted transposase/invertase (TIGR01784 family)